MASSIYEWLATSKENMELEIELQGTTRHPYRIFNGRGLDKKPRGATLCQCHQPAGRVGLAREQRKGGEEGGTDMQKGGKCPQFPL